MAGRGHPASFTRKTLLRALPPYLRWLLRQTRNLSQQRVCHPYIVCLSCTNPHKLGGGKSDPLYQRDANADVILSGHDDYEDLLPRRTKPDAKRSVREFVCGRRRFGTLEATVYAIRHSI